MEFDEQTAIREARSKFSVVLRSMISRGQAADIGVMMARWQFNILKPKMMAMELEMKHMRDQYVKDAKMMESQKLEIERLNVKSMAMEAEIQRLRGTLRKVEPGPLTEEELKWIEEDERG